MSTCQTKIFQDVIISFILVLYIIVKLIGLWVILHYLIGHLTIQMSKEGIDSSLYSLYFLRLFIGNIKAKVFLHGNYELNRVQRVEA